MTSRFFLALIFISIAAAAAFGQAVIEPPSFSRPPGIYPENTQLSITHPDNSVTIRYTTNGSRVTANSPVWERNHTISIINRFEDRNLFAEIRTTPSPSICPGSEPWCILPWQAPDGSVAKGTAIRAKAFRGNDTSRTIAGSFFGFSESSRFRSLPIVSIIVDSMAFFGHDSGIYIPGRHFNNSPTTGNYYMRGDDWERAGNFEFFNTNGSLVVSQTVGYRIHGAWTRRFPQKSLRVYARRGEYGERHINFKHRVFHNRPDSSYRRLLLRMGGNDFEKALIRDAAGQYMVSHVKTFETQAFRSVTVFLNGEFWGWHNIRERLDKHYMERVFDADPDNIDIVDISCDADCRANRNNRRVRLEASEGDTLAYSRMAAFARSNDLTNPVHFDSILKLIDIDSYVDHMAVQMLMGNADGIYNNHRVWRERRNFSPYAPVGQNGRFRWLIFDLDQTFDLWGDGYRFDQIHSSTNNGNELFRNLMANQSVRHHFVNSFANLLNTAFHPGRAEAVIDSIAGTIRPVIGVQVRRWGHPNWGGWDGGRDTSRWESEITTLRNNYRSRISAYRNTVREYYNAGHDTTVIFRSDTARGLIKVNSMVIDPRMPTAASQRSWSGSNFTWSGRYFSNIPITVSGAGKRHYRIDKWIVTGDGLREEYQFPGDSVLTIRLSSGAPESSTRVPVCRNCTIEAVFVHDSAYFYPPVIAAGRNAVRKGNLSISHNVRSRSNVAFNFTLPEASNAELRIYNLAGKEVGRVANGRFGPGSHQLNWNTGKMGSGVYIYRLKVQNRTLDGRLRL